MALVLSDRVKELSTTTGTGSFTLAGAPQGFQTFNAGVGVGNTCYYTISDVANNAWEVGIGTLSSGTILARGTVLASSNSNSLVNFSTGNKEVFVTYPASKAVYEAADGSVALPGAVTVAGSTTLNGVTATNASIAAFSDTTFDGSELETFVSWDSSADAYSIYAGGATQTHRGMKRCLLLDNGAVNYYLDPNDSTKKAAGSAAVLTGADGMVMVEIPKFYIKKTKVSNLNTWYISAVARSGYTVHPAFVKNGVEVNYRYYGAYDASYWDATDSTYKSGLNLDDITSLLDTTADKLASVSDVYPIVGVTRAECRLIAKNRGSGWRQLDAYLWNAVLMLYLTEYGNFNSQLLLGAGNTATNYAASSSTQTDSGASVAGKSNGLGNNSTNTVSGASSASRQVAFMSYRGIENLFGNTWNWVDGWNMLNYQSWMSNTDTQFADDTSANYTSIGATVPTTNNYVTNVQDLNGIYLPSAVGGSSTTYITDYFYIAGGNRVVVVGGSAIDGAFAGAFYVVANNVSGYSARTFGARLAF